MNPDPISIFIATGNYNLPALIRHRYRGEIGRDEEFSWTLPMPDPGTQTQAAGNQNKDLFRSIVLDALLIVSYALPLG